MSTIALLLLGGASLGLIIWFSRHYTKKVNERLQVFADQHGLFFSPASWTSKAELWGSFRGVEVKVYSITRGTGKNSTTYLVHKAQLSSSAAPIGLVMFHEGVLSKVGKFLGKEDIQTGMEDIDKAFIIRGAEEQEVLDFLHRPGVRRALIEFIRADRSMRIEDDEIHLEIVGSMSNVDHVRARLEMLVGFVEVLEQAGGQAIGAAGRSPAVSNEDKIGHW